MARPTIRYGSKGVDVSDVQRCLNVTPIDGDFGRITEQAVTEWQNAQGLVGDGIVGPASWARLEEIFTLGPYPPALLPPLTQPQIDQIFTLVSASPASKYAWKDRGRAPEGYLRGMALGWATVLRKYILRAPVALEMAQRSRGKPDTDALSWYSDIFISLKMDNTRDDVETLRHLWTLLIGLGMRESSGKYCEGRDMSATNVTADTCEAGAWQMSWNARGCSEYMQRLMDEYDQPGADVQGCRVVFAQNVTCSQSNWQNYGSGPGAKFQKMAKDLPQFAAETTAIGLRYLRKHWGPINRKEVEVLTIVDDMLRDIQEFIAAPEV